jgi:polar amino acid transport system substrate-binding protein
VSCARRAVAAVLVLAGLGACASVDVPESLPGATTSTTEAPAATDAPPDCGNPVASLRPSGPATSNPPAGGYMAEIKQRGRLRAGVDVGTLQLSSVDPLTGEFEGFDVDIAREVANALGVDIQFVGIPSSDRVAAVTEGRVDLVASAFTVNCARRAEIEFSTEYFHAGQRVLVRSDNPVLRASSPQQALQQLGEAGATICASAGSTAIDNINALGLDPAPTIDPAPQRADCLVRLQRGQTDAIVTDDAILAGMAAQDPSLGIVTNGQPLSDEPYGVGLPTDHPEWVRYVNAMLDDVRSSGRWEQLYNRWLGPLLGASAGPPAPVYRD